MVASSVKDAGLGQLSDGASEYVQAGASDLAKGTTQLATGATELSRQAHKVLQIN